MSKKIVNLFIVGLGNQFSKHLIYTIHSNKDSVFIKGICDINEEKMEIACDNNLQKLGFKEIPTKFKIFNEILTFAESNISKEKNVFIISTPPKYHFEYTVKCLESNFDVYVDKPLAMNGLSCQKIIDTAKKINRVVSIGSQRKFEQVFIKVLQHAKKVGEVQYSRNMRLTNWG